VLLCLYHFFISPKWRSCLLDYKYHLIQHSPNSSSSVSSIFSIIYYNKTQSYPSTTAKMVSFRALFTAAVAFSAPIMAQTTPAQVVSNIQMITQKSQALQAPAQSITIINGPLIVIGQGPFPQIISGFADIVSTGTTALAQMQGMPKVPAGAQSDAIFDAFREVCFTR
jgi:hypothetical protein